MKTYPLRIFSSVGETHRYVVLEVIEPEPVLLKDLDLTF
jgi:hypothetical protein